MPVQSGALPWDLRLAYAAVVLFASVFTLVVLVGPAFPLIVAWRLIGLALAPITLILACRLIFKRPRRQRSALVVTIAAGCLASAWPTSSGTLTDLYLIAHVYLAGGPCAVNNWAKKLMHDHKGPEGLSEVESEKCPLGVRIFIPGRIRIGCVLGLTWLDIELGGGFYHYGIEVFPEGMGPPIKWRQRVLGWPPEVVIGHEA